MPDVFVSGKKTTRRQTKNKGLERKKVVKKRFSRSDLPSASRFLSSFVYNPENLRFETQDKEEKIVLLLRRHPVTNFSWVLMVLLLSILPPFIFSTSVFYFVPGGYRLISFVCWYLLVFAFGFGRFLSWFFNVNILTDERVIDINFPNILYRDITETKIDRIQDINIKSSGYTRSLFNYGDVLIQTAGTIPGICFEAVPDPEQVSHILNELIYEEEQEKLDGRVK